MTRPTVVSVTPLDGYALRLEYSDGMVAALDWSERLERSVPGGLFQELRDRRLFARVTPWPEARTIRWPNGADICPEVLREWAERECGGSRP